MGKQIRRYRERDGLTLEQLSERSGVDVGTISALEQRDSKRSAYAGPIARAFGLTIEQLCDTSKTYPAVTAPPMAMEPVAVYRVKPADDWPFSLDKASYEALSDEDKGRIDGFMFAVGQAHRAALKKVSNGH